MTSSRTKTYAAAALRDTDGVVTAASTLTTAQQLTAGDFDGVAHSSGVFDLPRSLIVTLSNTTGAFTTDPIVATGRRGGSIATALFTPSDADGNETLDVVQAFDSLETIDIPAQQLTTGTITVGVQDICSPVGSPFRAIKLNADGTVHVQYGETSGSPTDAIPTFSTVREDVNATRVLTAASETTVGCTVYL